MRELIRFLIALIVVLAGVLFVSIPSILGGGHP